MMENLLILSAKNGNKRAFADLMKRYAKKIYYAAYSYLRNPDDAADISQDAFLKAYTHLHDFDESKAFFPWIYRITRNLCLNKIKRHESRNVGLPEYDLIDTTCISPESEIINRENVKILQNAINFLPDMFREIIILKHFEECSYAEIGEILEIPIGTVMSRLYNARKKLRELLVEQEYKDEM